MNYEMGACWPVNLPQLRMERRDLGHVPEILVPAGYLLRTYRPGDEAGIGAVFEACELGCGSREAVRERLMEREYFLPQRVFVVERDEAIVGTATAWVEPGDEPVGYLHLVGVLPSERGKRLGAALTVATLKEHHREGFEVQRLHTDDWRLAALRLYLDLGYYPLMSHEAHEARWGEVMRKLGRVKSEMKV